MPRRYPNRRRRRPGRRPSRGFSEPGFKQIYDVVLPLQGRQRKAFYNLASAGIVIGGAMAGAVLGGAWGGPLGAVLGLTLGIAAGGRFAEEQRFYRR
jgi:hypothetical protein